MDTLFALLAIFAGNSPVTGEFPAQRPVTQGFDLAFDFEITITFFGDRKPTDTWPDSADLTELSVSM